MEKKTVKSLVFVLAVFSFFEVLANVLTSNIPIHAATQTASQTAGPNSISISSNDTVAIDITPTSEQAIYTGTNVLSITNSCPNGATVTLTTNSNSDTAAANNLIRPGSDSLSKTIPATTGNSLANNSWGYSINNGSNYYAVPAKNETPATIYDSSSATSSADTVSVKYGIKMNNNIPSGNYSNDVVYTVAVKPACLSYTLSWDLNGGTGKTGADYSDTQVAYGSTIDLTDYTPTRDGYIFNGWSNGSSSFTGNETNVNVNDINARTLTLTADWNPVQVVWDFDYTGSHQTFIVPKTGTYKVELWGTAIGSYTKGDIQLNKDEKLYVYVGQNSVGCNPYTRCSGKAYNGGGNSDYFTQSSYPARYSGGGGATDIRFFGENYTPTSNELSWDSSLGLKSRIMVASSGAYADSGRSTPGGGLNGYSGTNKAYNGGGGTQTSGGSASSPATAGSFGKGGSGYITTKDACNNNLGTGGGAGYYGGGGGKSVTNSGSSDVSGGGGSGSSFISGYTGCNAINSSGSHTGQPNHYSGKVFTNSVMIDGKGCNWSTGSATNCGSNQPQPDGTNTTGRTGDGYARITYLGS